VFAQDAIGALANALPPRLAWIGQFLYTGGGVQLGASGPSISVLYSIVPWIGVMALGYAFGAVMTRPADERRRACFWIGGFATAGFLIAGVAVLMGAADQDGPPRLFVWLNQRKYPASQLYLVMTLGPPILLLPLAERARGAIASWFTTFGRVPMFYYLLHIPLIHALSLLVWRLRDGQVNSGWFASAPFVSIEPEARWSLALLYLVFAISVALLYLACRWYAEVKRRHRSSLLRYL
jgi:uncharacterized membrane protein